MTPIPVSVRISAYVVKYLPIMTLPFRSLQGHSSMRSTYSKFYEVLGHNAFITSVSGDYKSSGHIELQLFS